MCREQEKLKDRLEVEDGEEVASWESDTLPFAHLTTIAGVDISFDKAHPDHACAMLAVLSYPQLKVISYWTTIWLFFSNCNTSCPYCLLTASCITQYVH